MAKRGFKYIGNKGGAQWVQFRLPNRDIPYAELVQAMPDLEQRKSFVAEFPLVFEFDPPYGDGGEPDDTVADEPQAKSEGEEE